MKTLEELRADLQKHIGALEDFQKGIVDDAGESRDYTAEEVDELEKLTDAVERAGKLVATKEKADRLTADKAVPADGKTGKAAEPKKEPEQFKSLGEQLQAVAHAGMNTGGDRDPRLVWRAGLGANEATPSEGGFLVQTDFSTELMGLAHEMGHVMSRVRDIPLGSNSNGIELPAVDETSRADGARFGGVQSYWVDEGGTGTPSKPKFRNIEMKLNKLMCVGYATEELLADSTALEAIYKQAFAEEIVFKTEDSIFQGSGAGQPLGFLNAGALVTVAAESGQAAATIERQNILKMFNRMPARSKKNAVWLINQEINPQLWDLNTAGDINRLYRTPGESEDNTGATGFLMNKPVIEVEYASALGSVGDINFVDLSQYLKIDKGAPAAAESMHVRFLQDEMTFRLTFRVDGQPAWRSAMTPYNGSATQSPYVTLAAR